MNDRLIRINEAPESGKCVVYVMSRDQRINDNFALIYAQEKALELKLPLVVIFRLFKNSSNRSYEHVEFMLKGLEELSSELKFLNIPFILTNEEEITFPSYLKELKPAVLYFDFSPLKGPRQSAKKISKEINVSTYVVDSHNIIPVWVASDHQEFAAHTFRFKVHKYLENYVYEPKEIINHPHNLKNIPESLSIEKAYEYIDNYQKSGIKLQFKSGEKSASSHLDKFLKNYLKTYAVGRNNVAIDMQSGLSPYLHFGQISSLKVVLEVLKKTGSTPLLFEQPKMAKVSESPNEIDGMNVLFEEMIVRKELSDNFCFYAKDYKSFDSIHAWAIKTLVEHNSDEREFLYNLEEFRNAQTHDKSWNAAQLELTKTGKIHGYMRMYWAKKILEWTKTPEDALEIAIYLNDFYSIDGGDPNGYVGILWAIAGLHDRPWFERPIFGKIRYMNEEGLKRKFDINAYIDRVNKL